MTDTLQRDLGAAQVHPALAALDPDAVAALSDAAAFLESKTAAGGLLADPERVRGLLTQLTQSTALRSLVATRLAAAGTPPAGPAAQLLSPDTTTAAAAARAARTAFDTAVRDQRAERRRERRTKTTEMVDASTLDRMRRDRDAARTDRDTARTKADRAEAEAAHLRDQLAETHTALADAQQQVDDDARSLHRLRSRHTDPAWLAGTLAGVLDDLARSAGDRDSTAHQLLAPISAHLEPLMTGLRKLSVPPARTEELALRVEMLGGIDIGASCVLVTAGDDALLIDCGAQPGDRPAAESGPPGLAKVKGRKLAGVVITHAHHDHAGYVPALLAQHRGLAVYATSPTADILATMWRDSARVMARRADPAFGQGEVDRALDALVETAFGTPLRIGSLTVELFPAGHIVGAASVVVTAGGQRVVISGDVSVSKQATVDGFLPSASAQAPDLLVLESTYGADTEQEPRAAAVEAFVSTARNVTNAGGVLLVPAFALGRAQEVALLCKEKLPDVPVLIDGLAREVSEVYERHLPEGRRVFGDHVRAVPAGGTREAIAKFRTGVVISTSGMLHQGPVLAWARRVLPDPRSGLAVVGYQDAESPGRKLLRLADTGGGMLDLPTHDGNTERIEVQASVTRFGLGAHANAAQLRQIVQRLQPHSLMLVHGEEAARGTLGNTLRRMGHTATRDHTWTHA